MDLKLANKLALATGSTADIGLAIAIALAQEGAEFDRCCRASNSDSDRKF